MTAKGLGEKAREWDDLKTGPKLSKALRKFIADTLNAELAAEGKADLARVEYRSFEARGIAAEAGAAASGTGQNPRAAQRHRRLPARHGRRGSGREQRETHAKERASLKLRQDFALQGKLAELEQRGREGREAIRRDLEAAGKADIPPNGIPPRVPDVTGQDMRDSFNRQHREAQRGEGAREQKRAALKAEIQAERNAFVRGQVEERERLIERHKGRRQAS